MASIIEAVLKSTIGLIVDKGRDLAAKNLTEGDVTDERFRIMIIRELDDIKSKLDGMARKDLLTSISFFKEGIVFLYQVLDKIISCEEGQLRATEHEAVGGREENYASVNTVSLLSEFVVSDLDDAGKRALSDGKKRFDEARIKATEAFNNVALSTFDRILAMQYRVMSTILQKIDHTKEAIAACLLCLEELHSMPAVKKSFTVEVNGGFRSMFKKNERKEIVESVRDVNRVIFTMVQLVDGISSREFDNWPCISIGESLVNPFDSSSTRFTHLVPWSFGQEGKYENRLTRPNGITTNTQEHFIVADNNDIKVFDHNGNFLFSFFPNETDALDIKDVATDFDDNIYVLNSSKVYVFDSQANMRWNFPLREMVTGERLTVAKNKKVFVLGNIRWNKKHVEVYEADGKFCNSFGREQNWRPTCIASNSSEGVVICDVLFNYQIYDFDARGKLVKALRKPLWACSYHKLQNVRIAFHPPTERLLMASPGDNCVYIAITTRDGEFTRIFELREAVASIEGLAVTTEGRIALACTRSGKVPEERKHVVLVLWNKVFFRLRNESLTKLRLISRFVA